MAEAAVFFPDVDKHLRLALGQPVAVQVQFPVSLADGAASYELWTNAPVACSAPALQEAVQQHDALRAGDASPAADAVVPEAEGDEWHPIVLIYQGKHAETGHHVASRLFVPISPGEYEYTARIVRVDGEVQWLSGFGRNAQLTVAPGPPSTSLGITVPPSATPTTLLTLHPVALHVMNEVLFALLTEDAGFVGGAEAPDAIEAGLALWGELAGQEAPEGVDEFAPTAPASQAGTPTASGIVASATIVALAAVVRVHCLASRAPFWENPTLLNDAVCVARVLAAIPLTHAPRWQAKVLQVFTHCHATHAVAAVRDLLSPVAVTVLPHVRAHSSWLSAPVMQEGGAAGASRHLAHTHAPAPQAAAFGTGMGLRSHFSGSDGSSGGPVKGLREMDAVTDDGASSISSLGTDDGSAGSAEAGQGPSSRLAGFMGAGADTEQSGAVSAPSSGRGIHRPKRLKLARAARDRLRTPGERALLLLARWAAEGCVAAPRSVLSVAEEAFSASVQCAPSGDCSADLILYAVQRLLIEGRGSMPRKVYFIRVLQEFLAKPHVEAAKHTGPAPAMPPLGEPPLEGTSLTSSKPRRRTPIAKLVVVAVQDVVLSYVAAASSQAAARQQAAHVASAEDEMLRDVGQRGHASASAGGQSRTSAGAAVQAAGLMGSGMTRHAPGPANGPNLTPSLIPIMQFMAQALGRSAMLTGAAIRGEAVGEAGTMALSCKGCDACALNPSAFSLPDAEAREEAAAMGTRVARQAAVTGKVRLPTTGVVVDPSTVPTSGDGHGYDAAAVSTQEAARAVSMRAANAAADAQKAPAPASLAALGKVEGGMHALRELALCPRWNATPGGKPSVTMWLEASKALAIAAVKLSAMDSEANGGLRDDSEYEHVLEVCLILAKSCPLLRATILKRILRKWPKGYADNEVALLRFLGRVLSDAHALQDLVITRLAGDMTGRVVSCMQSAHVKVLKAAFGLAAPSSRHFFELVKGQPGALGRIIAGLQDTASSHWSPAVRNACEDFEAWYWDKIDPALVPAVREAVEAVRAAHGSTRALRHLMAGEPGVGQLSPLQGVQAPAPPSTQQSRLHIQHPRAGSPLPGAVGVRGAPVSPHRAGSEDNPEAVALGAAVRAWRGEESVTPTVACAPSPIPARPDQGIVAVHSKRPRQLGRRAGTPGGTGSPGPEAGSKLDW